MFAGLKSLALSPCMLLEDPITNGNGAAGQKSQNRISMRGAFGGGMRGGRKCKFSNILLWCIQFRLGVIQYSVQVFSILSGNGFLGRHPPTLESFQRADKNLSTKKHNGAFDAY